MIISGHAKNEKWTEGSEFPADFLQQHVRFLRQITLNVTELVVYGDILGQVRALPLLIFIVWLSMLPPAFLLLLLLVTMVTCCYC